MKLLTLNTNSYVGQDAISNMAALCQAIADGGYDVIALQEVNQDLNKPEVPLSELDDYIPCQDRVAVKEDNYAFQIVQALRASGQHWTWSWLAVHVGWGKFDEGLAILTPHTIRKTNAFFVSRDKNYWNPKTRMALGTQIEIDSRKQWFYSVHFDKWHDASESFDGQWDRFARHALDTAAPVFVMGDFNNDANVKNEGYDYVLTHSGLFDTYAKAEYKDAGMTVGDYIAGWSEHDHPKEIRVDFIFSNTDLPVLSSQIVFNGKDQKPVSDHFGLEVTLGEKYKVFKKDPTHEIPPFTSRADLPQPPSVVIRAGALSPDNPVFRRRVQNRLLWQELTELLDAFKKA